MFDSNYPSAYPSFIVLFVSTYWARLYTDDRHQRLRNGQMEFNASTVETLALHFGNTVDRLGFSRQVRRIEELRKAVTGLLVGGSKIIWNGMDHEHWGKQAYEFRRGIRTGKKVSKLPLVHS